MKKPFFIVLLFFALLMVGAGIYLLVPKEEKIKTGKPAIPQIPGLKLVDEKEEDCSYEASYLYPTDAKSEAVSEKIKDSIKSGMLMSGWRLEKEKPTAEFWQLEFLQEEKVLELKVGPEEQGISLILKIKQPCQ